MISFGNSSGGDGLDGFGRGLGRYVPSAPSQSPVSGSSLSPYQEARVAQRESAPPLERGSDEDIARARSLFNSNVRDISRFSDIDGYDSLGLDMERFNYYSVNNREAKRIPEGAIHHQQGNSATGSYVIPARLDRRQGGRNSGFLAPSEFAKDYGTDEEGVSIAGRRGAPSWEVGGYGMGGVVQGYASGGEVGPAEALNQDVGASPEEMQLVMGAIAALDSNSDMDNADRNMILAAFEEYFGEGALAELMEEISSVDDGKRRDNFQFGNKPSPEDTVPAMLQPGEFVLPKREVQNMNEGKTIGREDLREISANAGRPMGLGGNQ